MLDLLLLPPLLAHQLQIDQAIAGTLHLEPNDQPQAGIPTPTWIALRRAGGEPIVAADCDCRLQLLNVQAQTTTDLVIQPLESAPGAVATKIVFPAVGRYELILKGQPQATAQIAFDPFQIRFPVTVAIAAPPAAEPPAEPVASPDETETPEPRPPRPWLRVWISVGLGVGLLVALAAGVWLILKRDREAS
ncbi:hypothetical protein [Synechococcus elongatus]|uniref:Uncharacterized protein n=1 Tax=Synechococcus elongatus PCC 11801 TaxID=2219813 RepID=A0AAN1UTN4_SYNEL|nr:hypothetical protein [Synechococcus elongatus]AZB71706.1 hypothetical protein DOP62_02295 [Synechococcus elongatus PCC 11801]